MNHNINLRNLIPSFYTLSKTKVVNGIQCEKYLYLSVHKPKYKTPPDELTVQKFKKGRSFEAIFKESFSNGIAVNEILKKDLFSQGVAFTNEIFNQNRANNLFEACFLYNKTLVMTDVCQIQEDGSYIIYEVKNSVEEKEVFIQDMAIQYYVCSHSRKGLAQFNLVLPDGNGGFKIIDKTETLKAFIPNVEQQIIEFLKILKQEEEPSIEMGAQCFQPYKCEFIEYCTKENTQKANPIFKEIDF
ncbi:MAG TPA: hypothetical protein VLZ83_05845 [Edaphocola sp.]|nr:hypothetical protein [Edaphocola sp.]